MMIILSMGCVLAGFCCIGKSDAVTIGCMISGAIFGLDSAICYAAGVYERTHQKQQYTYKKEEDQNE